MPFLEPRTAVAKVVAPAKRRSAVAALRAEVRRLRSAGPVPAAHSALLVLPPATAAGAAVADELAEASQTSVTPRVVALAFGWKIFA